MDVVSRHDASDIVAFELKTMLVKGESDGRGKGRRVEYVEAVFGQQSSDVSLTTFSALFVIDPDPP